MLIFLQFSGTIRSNLDPFQNVEDVELWMALKRVHFLDSLQQSPDFNGSLADQSLMEENDSNPETLVGTSSGSPMSKSKSFSLDQAVMENGNNFSQGSFVGV